MLHILCKRAQIVTRLSIARVNITRRSYNATSPRYGSQKVPLQSRVASKKTQKNVRKSLRIEHEKEKGAGEHASTIELRRSGSQDILHKEPTTELHDAQVTKTPVAKPARKPRSRKADVTAKACPKVKDLMRHPRRHADRINIVSTGLCGQ